MMRWVIGSDGSYMCSKCGKVFRYEIGNYCSNCGEKLEYIEYDRDTALQVIKDFSKVMRVSNDLFGRKILCIGTEDFEVIRSKYLG